MKYLLLITFLLLTSFLFGQNGSLKGIVTTTDGKPVASVTISINSLKRSTYTDEDGHYLLTNVKPGNYSVTCSHIGLDVQQIQVTITTGKTTELTFSLKETAKQLNEVIVTTDKTTINKTPSVGKAGLLPLENPQSVGIVSNAVIKDQQAMRLADVVKNISGLSFTQQRQGVAETFSARGYSIGISGGTGSIFKNGISSNTSGFPEASTLESVEVLKGSSALLYGNTSAGVVINMVTKKPRFDWGGEISMTAGSNDLYKPIVDIYGSISKDLAFRVVGTYEHSRSYRDVVHTQRKYVNPSLMYKLGKKTTILLQGDYLDADVTPDYGIGAPNNKMNITIPASRNRFINTSWAYYNSKTASGSLVIDHNFNDTWKLNVIAAAQNVKINAYGTGVPNSIDSNGSWNRSLSRVHSNEWNQTAQANLTGKFRAGFLSHQVLIGTDYFGSLIKTDAFRITSANGVVGTAYDKINIFDLNMYPQRTDIPNTLDTGRTESPSYRLGYYAQDLIGITSKLKVLAGLRWSFLESKAATIYNYIKNTQTSGAISTNSAFSPKGAIIYEFTQNVSVYASYANSFTTNSGIDVNGNPLDPSIIDQYEIGWKNMLFKGKVAANLSIYKIQNSNLAQQVVTLPDGTPNTNTNIKELTGATVSNGFDIDLSGTISKGLYFMAGFAYSDAHYTKSTGASNAVVEGETLNNNPLHTANATVFYTFQRSAIRGLKLGVSGFYTGKRFGGNQNTVGQKTAYNNQIPLSDFTTIDVSAGYAFHKISVLIKLSNITNTLNYMVHDRYSINPITPRQFVATVSYRF